MVLANNLFQMPLADTHPCGKEIYILGATLLVIPRGPLCNRRDARDKEPLREPARLLALVWEDKRYAESTSGPTLYERKKRHASIGFSGSYELHSYQRREENLFWMPEQYQGPVSILVEYKVNNKYGREKNSKT
jgi:hypothetical protein